MKSSKSTSHPRYLSLFRILLLGSFLLLSFFAHQFAYFQLDLRISRSLQGINSPFFSLVMNIVSELGDDFHLEIIVALAVGTLFFVGYRRESFRALLFAVSAATIGSLLKVFINRPRPDSGLVQIQEIFLDKSFPSLHVLVFTAFFGYMFYLSLYKVQRFWLRLLIASGSVFLILTVGLSRIYLGAHWASDVLGGYLLGLWLFSIIIAHAKR